MHNGVNLKQTKGTLSASYVRFENGTAGILSLLVGRTNNYQVRNKKPSGQNATFLTYGWKKNIFQTTQTSHSKQESSASIRNFTCIGTNVNDRIRNQQMSLNSLSMIPSPGVDENHQVGAFCICVSNLFCEQIREPLFLRLSPSDVTLKYD